MLVKRMRRLEAGARRSEDGAGALYDVAESLSIALGASVILCLSAVHACRSLKIPSTLSTYTNSLILDDGLGDVRLVVRTNGNSSDNGRIGNSRLWIADSQDSGLRDMLRRAHEGGPGTLPERGKI
jgi:hypothetical protein